VALAPIIQKRDRAASTWTAPVISQALRQSFVKLDPRTLVRNPVIFLVELGAAITTVLYLRDLLQGDGFNLLRFELQVVLWLWFTVLFANFAEAIAEGRGKAQAASLRRTRTESSARRVRADGRFEDVPGSLLRKATSSSSKPASLSPATATSSKASHT